MAKPKQIYLCMIILCMLLGIGAGTQNAIAQTPESTSNQFTQMDRINTDWENYQEIPEFYEPVAENDAFQLVADRTSLAFKVVDKRSGYVWHSNLDEAGELEDDRLNRTWTAFARSGISIDYLDPKAISERASLTNADQTIDFQLIEQGFQAFIKFTEPSISLVLIVKLEPGGVSVEVPFGLIKQENPDFKLGFLYVYPFLGATREAEVPGYMFIPDGSGSLIRFSAQTKAKNMFYGRYYGADLGMIAKLPYDPMTKRPNKISTPVFGMVHGYMQNAFISIVEKGASYGELQVHPSGVITNFNFLFNAFVYNESYFQATNRAGAGVTTLQRNTNAFDILIHYRFLTGEASDYVGMARSYQQYLLEKGILKRVSDPSGDIGIKLEFLGGEKEKILIWNRVIPMTTINQMNEILRDTGIKNLDVVYYGWQPFGASSMPSKTFKLDKNLGSMDELRTFIENIKIDGGNFYLYLDPIAALENEKGYSPRNDLAMAITNVNLIGYNRNKVNYYLNYDVMSKSYASLSEGVFTDLRAGLALDNIGSTLFSDFKQNHLLNRENAIQMYQQLLDQNKGTTAFFLPNDYFYGFMDAYYDMPLINSGYIYTTDAVPFLQIILAGYVPYFGPALNFSSNMQEDLLRQVDFGVYPSYFLSYDLTAKILNTGSSWIYTSSYSQWSGEIKQAYQWLNNLLGPVKGQTIVARQVLEEGVVATSYGNGKQIIINYRNTPVSVDGLVVNSKDAVIREVLP